MTPTSKQQALKAALIWELCWTPVEMVSVGIGLWMSLTLHWITVGNLWFIAFLAIDFIVRYRHYSVVAPGVHGPQLER